MQCAQLPPKLPAVLYSLLCWVRSFIATTYHKLFTSGEADQMLYHKKDRVPGDSLMFPLSTTEAVDQERITKADQIYIKTMVWCKQNEFPEHEFLVFTVQDCERKKDSPKNQESVILVERTTPSAEARKRSSISTLTRKGTPEVLSSVNQLFQRQHFELIPFDNQESLSDRIGRPDIPQACSVNNVTTSRHATSPSLQPPTSPSPQGSTIPSLQRPTPFAQPFQPNKTASLVLPSMSSHAPHLRNRTTDDLMIFTTNGTNEFVEDYRHSHYTMLQLTLDPNNPNERFSVSRLALLAHAVHGFRPEYDISYYHCYWFARVIWDTVRDEVKKEQKDEEPLSQPEKCGKFASGTAPLGPPVPKQQSEAYINQWEARKKMLAEIRAENIETKQRAERYEEERRRADHEAAARAHEVARRQAAKERADREQAARQAVEDELKELRAKY